MPRNNVPFRALVVITASLGAGLQGCAAAGTLDNSLVDIRQRLKEERHISPHEHNSITYRRAIGELPLRSISPRELKAERTLTLEECLQFAFANSNDIRQSRERIIAVGGSELIAKSRFLPTVEVISQYEHFRNFASADAHDDAHSLKAQITQRIFEYGKDNPTDVELRLEQRNALFDYENQVASILSDVRKAFLFITLKDQQIGTRRELLTEFEKQYERKKQRMEAGNLSVKVEVLTARLNVLNEETRINTLVRQQFNRKVELLRLIGLPVGADLVTFVGQTDTFGLEDFNEEWAINLALSQSSEVALTQAELAEQQRVLDQLLYEYIPDLRLSAGYQDVRGRAGASVSNENNTWGLDLVGEPRPFDRDGHQALGLFPDDVLLPGPEPGWFAGVQLRIPLFEGYARRGRKLEAEAERNRLEAKVADQLDLVEMQVRQAYMLLHEQDSRVRLEEEKVRIAKERLSIKEQLRAIGNITDDELETFRNEFFESQDSLFQQQEALIERQEDLRLSVRYFK